MLLKIERVKMINDILEVDIIKEVIEKYDIKIIEVIEGIDINKSGDIPDKCGVYILNTETGKYYIAASENIKIRAIQHRNGYSSKLSRLGEEIVSVDVCLIEGKTNALVLRDKMIELLKPELNMAEKKKTPVKVGVAGFVVGKSCDKDGKADGFYLKLYNEEEEVDEFHVVIGEHTKIIGEPVLDGMAIVIGYLGDNVSLILDNKNDRIKEKMHPVINAKKVSFRKDLKKMLKKG